MERAEAKALGLKHFETGRPCVHGHMDKRFTAGGRCMECARLSSKLWNKEHPDIIRVRLTNWSLENPERRAEHQRKAARVHYAKNTVYYALKMRRQQLANPALFQRNNMNYQLRKKNVGGVLSKDIWNTLYKKQTGLCVYCKVDLMSVKTAIDHIKPIKLGGTNTDNNVQLLCVSCNCKKGAKYPYKPDVVKVQELF